MTICKPFCTLLILPLFLVGCVSASPVVEVESNRYFVTAKDTGGMFSKDGKVVGEAKAAADAHCGSMGKVAVIEDLKRDPEGPFRFETSDLYFSCQ